MATHTLPASHLRASHLHSSSLIDDEDAALLRSAPARQRPAVLRRLYDAILRSQMRRAQREIDRVLGPGALERVRRGEWPPER